MRALSKTDTGKRRRMNQDYVFLSETPVGALPNLLILADGMGGHNAGDYASRYTVETIVDSVKKGQNRYFYAIVSKQEMQNEDAKKIIDTRFKGSFINFLCAFSKETKLSKEEIKQIKEWAEHLDDE